MKTNRALLSVIAIVCLVGVGLYVFDLTRRMAAEKKAVAVEKKAQEVAEFNAKWDDLFETRQRAMRAKNLEYEVLLAKLSQNPYGQRQILAEQEWVNADYRAENDFLRRLAKVGTTPEQGLAELQKARAETKKQTPPVPTVPPVEGQTVGGPTMGGGG